MNWKPIILLLGKKTTHYTPIS
uniref:Uncharacterized protein n=1 Tax=Anguilla anguilla TaxID=7936 RepID=A0A0E9V820_ANGAN